jgi:hypothetical protein
MIPACRAVGTKADSRVAPARKCFEKKLITACCELHRTIAELKNSVPEGDEKSSTVAETIRRLRQR